MMNSRPLAPLPGFDPARFARRYPMMRAVAARSTPQPIATVAVKRPCQFCGGESPPGCKVRGQPACRAHLAEVREYQRMARLNEQRPLEFERRYGIARAHAEALREDEQQETARTVAAYHARRAARLTEVERAV